MSEQPAGSDSERAQRLSRPARRAQLLDAAGEVFTTRGFHSASMDDIADAAGVSKPVLYQHFGSKLELYLALVDRACDELLDLVTSAIASTSDNGDRVVATVGAFYDYVSASSRQFRFVFESDLTGELQVRDRLWRLQNQLSDRIAAVIAADTDLAPDRAQLLAISLVGLAEVSARYWVMHRRDIDLAEATRLVSALAWRGIGGVPRADDAG